MADLTRASKFALISDFNIQNLAPLLARHSGIDPVCAPYGQVAQTLMSSTSDVWTPETVGAIVWTSPSYVSNGYQRFCDGEESKIDEILNDVDRFVASLASVPTHIRHIFVPTWSPLHRCETRRGLLDLNPSAGISILLMKMNLRLAEAAQNDPRVQVFDSARWPAMVGERAFDSRLWYLTKTPYVVDVFRQAARDFAAALRALEGGARKLLILDLDNTLWGGVVGDLGWQKLRLGGHDATGEAYRDFQSLLKGLMNRGVLLAIVSKNDEAIALEAIKSHPEMVLELSHFAGWRINWKDKAENIADLVAELNLGLDSAVFIDDNPAERARVREALPQIFVPDWPANPLYYPAALRALDCFDAPFVSDEDRNRTKMYVSERERRDAQERVQSLDQWLETLNLTVTVEQLGQGNLERTLQLLNKTNQMNLRTRRLSSAELATWAGAADHRMLVFRVSDRFGDYGLVGIGSFELDRESDVAHLVDFVLSCRVMGRQVEQTMLGVLAQHARTMGARRMLAEYLATARNKPCRAFLENSGLFAEDGTDRFFLDLNSEPSLPKTVNLVSQIAVDASRAQPSPESAVLENRIGS